MEGNFFKLLPKKLPIFLIVGVVASLIVSVSTDSFAAKKKAEGVSTIVNINTADEKTLETLPGVGKATAKAIIAGRPYKSVDDLKRVKGMTDTKIKALKDLVTVEGTTASSAAANKVTSAEKAVSTSSAGATQKVAAAEKSTTEKTSAVKKLAPGQRININTATKDELQALPGIGSVKAQAIIDSRPYDKPEDIMKVKGIKQKTFDKLKDYIVVR